MNRYYSLRQYFRDIFGHPVSKICIDAGFSCPNRDGTKGTGGCIYCNDVGSGAPYIDRNHSVREQISTYLENRNKKDEKYIAYFQAFSNTYADLQTLKDIWYSALDFKNIVGISIGTRPDCVEDRILDLIAEFSEQTHVWLEFGFETIHDKTLQKLNRKHSFQESLDAYSRAKLRGIRVCPHIIIGLPGENDNDILKTAQTVGALKPDGIKIHSLYIETGTKLYDLYRKQPWKLMTMQEYSTITARFLEYLHEECVIHRLVGDAVRGKLYKPDWTQEKQLVLQEINNKLKEWDSKQGARFSEIKEDVR